MLFSSLLFLFLFLPIALFLYRILRTEFRNVFLLIASLVFYAWGEGELVLIMIASIFFNYIIGNAIDHYKSNQGLKKLLLALGVILNLSMLIYFKYINFIFDNINALFSNLNLQIDDITLPIGISFFTFQSLSYLVDVYRKIVPPQKNVIDLGLYISLFPQLIAGPIVRYEDIHKEIKERTVNNELFKEGVLKFIRGLSKKVVIANTTGFIADQVFALPASDLGSSVSWIGIICYALQIYYDFSGYSDMAIGLGKMFGFNFKENFEHPYISRSIKEFWRRWHISLSSWFRDYLYIPLGGNRKSNARTYVNLIIVFFVTGLWHGASWNFIFWGLFHGAFLLLERRFNIKLPKQFQFLDRIYLILVVLIGWVFFRAEDLAYAIEYIVALFSFKSGTNNLPLTFITTYTILIIGIGVVFSAPVRLYLKQLNLTSKFNLSLATSVKYVVYFSLFLYSVLELVQSNYNPFIYFRF